MSLSGLVYLLRARLRGRMVLVQEGFALFGVSVGVALLFASQVASTSLSHSAAQLDRGVVGDSQFQLESRGPDGFSDGLLGEVRRVPGVQAALPVLEQTVTVIGRSGRRRSVDLIGTDPRLAGASGPLLQRFSTARLSGLHAIVLPASVAHAIDSGVLSPIRLQVGVRVMGTLLGVVLGEQEIGGLVNSPIALASVGYAQRLTNMQGRITRIFVRCESGRERSVGKALARLAGATVDVRLESADYDARLFAVAVAPEDQSEDLFSVISALVGFMFALNAMLITVPARRRLIGEIGLLGATRATLLKIVLFDALLLGALACLLGIVLGEALSLAVFGTTPGYLSFAFPVGNYRIVTWQSIVLAVGAGMTAAVVGVLWPLRDVLLSDSRGKNRGTHRKRGKWSVARLSLGVMCLGFTTIISVVHDQGEVIGNVALIIAIVCLLPPFFDASVTLFERAQRPFGRAASALAIVELRTPHTRVRSLAIAATAAVAVFGTVEFQGIQRNLADGLDASARGIDSGAQIWVTATGEANALATTAFEDSDSRTLVRLPGVQDVGLYRGGLLNWGRRRLWVLAPPASSRQPIPVSQILSGDPVLAARRIAHGGWAVISQALASEHGLYVGRAFELPAPRTIQLRVAAISTNLAWPPGAIIMSSADYARAWQSNEPSAYEIDARPGRSIAAVRSEVQRALGARARAGLVVETTDEREQRHDAIAAQGLSRLTQIRALLLIAAVFAVTAAMGSMVWQRRNLIAFMKVDGYRQGSLWRWLICESAVLLLTGCSIGAVFGLYGQFLGSRFLASVTGFPIVLQIQVPVALISLTLVSLVAMTVTAVPGYLVARAPAKATSPAY